MRALAAASLALLAGCTSRAINRFELGELEVELGFFVLFDEDARISRIGAPFGLTPDHQISFGSLPAIDLDENESSAVLVAFRAGALATAVPGFDLANAGETWITDDAPPERPAIEREDGEKGVMMLGVPRNADLLQITVSEDDNLQVGERAPSEIETAIQTSLLLHLPVDFEYCRLGDPTPLAPLSGSPTSFGLVFGSADPAATYFRRMERIDRSNIVLATWSYAILVDTAASFSTVPSRTGPTRALELSMPGVPISSLAVDPTPEPDGARRVLVTSGAEQTPGAIYVARAAAGGLTSIETSTITPSGLGDIAIDASGRVLAAVLGTAKLLERNPGERDFHVVELATRAAGDNIRRIIATQNPDLPFAVATQGRIHFWDARLGEWFFEDINQGGILALEPVRVEGMTSRGSGEDFELWAGAQYGQIFHRTGRLEWSRYELTLPPRAWDCYQTTSPRPHTSLGMVQALAVNGDRLFATLARCTPLIVTDHRASCAAIIRRETEPPAPDRAEVHSIDVREDSVVVSGDLTTLLGTSW